MGAVVSKEANDRWLSEITPIKGEFRALMFGVAMGLLAHPNRYTLQWERENIMYALQRIKSPLFAKTMWFLGQFCSADFLVPYFAVLYWTLDKYKCIYGIWLVPISEMINGILKWFFRVPRPGWVDPKVEMKAWSHEYSFPSSHSQMIWALATFFSGTSVSFLRVRLYGSRGRTALAYWYFLIAPFLFAATVSLARVYEGVHYPRDVLAGAGVGIGLASIYMRFLPMLKDWIQRKPLIMRIAFLQSFAMLMLHSIHRSHQRSITVSRSNDELHAWIANAAVGPHQGKNLDVHSVPLSSYLGMAGVLSGLALCVPLARSVNHSLPTTLSRSLARVLLGNSVLLSTYFGVRVVEKKAFEPGSIGERVARFLRYATVPINVIVTCPALFRLLGL